MSGGVACKCVTQLTFRETLSAFRKRNWRVYKRNCNYSAFNGYKRTYSDYSAVQCRKCRARWRTKADYVNYLEDGELI